jgi:hypothetical protein
MQLTSMMMKYTCVLTYSTSKTEHNLCTPSTTMETEEAFPETPSVPVSASVVEVASLIAAVNVSSSQPKLSATKHSAARPVDYLQFISPLYNLIGGHNLPFSLLHLERKRPSYCGMPGDT